MDWDWLNTFSTYSNNTPPDHTGYFFNPNPYMSPQPTDQSFTLVTSTFLFPFLIHRLDKAFIYFLSRLQST